MSYRGKYSGEQQSQQSYDRYMAHNEQSTIHKIKESYWTTKQYVKRKLGKKEDEHVVASDSQLDSKLSVFKAIQKSSMDLLCCIEKYQDRLCALSQEENTMGRFLKNETQHDKTRAGKMMAAVGKSQSHASQQRLALRVPLVRLFQEVETFRYRAISDTLMTINRMEAARTEYRGALLWMKDASEELDPDTYKQLEKFRKVQAQVKKTKARFDKLKLDTMQKIDLLAASRCNMFSHVLATYQTTLLHFWEKTSRTHTAVAESFKGYQYFEFNLLKELAEPSKQLTNDGTPQDAPERDTDPQGLYSDSEGEEQDGELKTKRTLKHLPDSSPNTNGSGSCRPMGLGLNSTDALLGMYSEEAATLQSSSASAPSSSVQSPPCNKCQDADSHRHNASHEQQPQHPLLNSISESLSEPLLRLYGDDNNHPGGVTQEPPPRTKHAEIQTACEHRNGVAEESRPSQELDRSQEGDVQDMLDTKNTLLERGERNRTHTEELLIDFDVEKPNGVSENPESGSMSNLFHTDKKSGAEDSEPTAFIDFGDDEEEESIEEIKRKQDEEFDISGGLFKSKDEKKQTKEQKDNADLLTEEFEPDDANKDDLTLLNEILNAPGDDDFSHEWQSVFGTDSPLNPVAIPTTAEPDQPKPGATFMPSNLLGFGGHMASMNINQGSVAPWQQQLPGQLPSGTVQQPPAYPSPAPQLPGQRGAMQPPQGMMGNVPALGGARQSGGMPATQQPSQVPLPTKSKAQKADMSAWFNLFADLDPLSNPDAVGSDRGQSMDGAL